MTDYKEATLENGETIKYRIFANGYGWDATSKNYDGPEDKIGTAFSSISPQDAADKLVENLNEAKREDLL